jgi:hypothetical protein
MTNEEKNKLTEKVLEDFRSELYSYGWNDLFDSFELLRKYTDKIEELGLDTDSEERLKDKIDSEIEDHLLSM